VQVRQCPHHITCLHANWCVLFCSKQMSPIW
jgi:hypothetical protein